MSAQRESLHFELYQQTQAFQRLSRRLLALYEICPHLLNNIVHCTFVPRTLVPLLSCRIKHSKELVEEALNDTQP